MKKSNLLTSACFLFTGAILLVISFYFESKLDNLLFSLGFTYLIIGLFSIAKYCYWRTPTNSARYQERLEEAHINAIDERKEMLRNKAGRQAYIIGMATACLSAFIFAVLDQLEIIADATPILIYLGGFIVFEYLIGIVIYRRLCEKY